MTYAEKLKDPRWQKKRLEVLNRDKWMCKSCGDTSSTLHVHHQKYSGDPWEIDARYLITLCEQCHAAEESIKKDYERKFLDAFYGAGFISSDLFDLTTALGNYNHDLPHVSEVVASAIGAIIKDKERLIDVIENYFGLLVQKDGTNG